MPLREHIQQNGCALSKISGKMVDVDVTRGSRFCDWRSVVAHTPFATHEFEVLRLHCSSSALSLAPPDSSIRWPSQHRCLDSLFPVARRTSPRCSAQCSPETHCVARGKSLARVYPHRRGLLLPSG
eukprot:3218365-Pleurochrysis_carterae.AAC.3